MLVRELIEELKSADPNAQVQVSIMVGAKDAPVVRRAATLNRVWVFPRDKTGGPRVYLDE
jgi:hypothetical protein